MDLNSVIAYEVEKQGSTSPKYINRAKKDVIKSLPFIELISETRLAYLNYIKLNRRIV